MPRPRHSDGASPGPRLRTTFLAATLLFGLVGCKPSVGDSCNLSTDCSVTGDRLCDTSMPGGYCTIFDCNPDACPDTSACVEFHPGQPRFARRFCLATCGSPSDCRPGYVCVEPAKRDAHFVDKGAPSHPTVCLP